MPSIKLIRISLKFKFPTLLLHPSVFTPLTGLIHYGKNSEYIVCLSALVILNFAILFRRR